MLTVTLPRSLVPAFWRYLGSLAATAVADAVLFVALPFVVLGAQGGRVGLGTVLLAGSAPRFLAPLLGTLADRWPGRSVLTVTATLRAALLAGVAWLALSGHAAVPTLAAFAFLNGCLVTLSFTAGSALVPHLVPEEQRPQANSLSSAALMGLPLIGYGVGGALIHGLGSAATLLAGVPVYVLALLLAASLPARPAEPTAGAKGFWHDLRGGLGVVRAQPLLQVMILLSFAMNLTLNVVNVRAPLFMQHVGAGAGGYALFEGLTAAGALVGALAVGALSARVKADTLIDAGRLLCVLAVLGLAVPQVPVWFVAAALLGLSLGVLEVAAVTRAQGLVAPGTLGRVMGVFLGLNALGLSSGAVIGSWPLASTPLFIVLAALLGALGLLWHRAVRSSPQP
ncbi:MFS family permease [Deinococcus metalli]|uniref:MFS family permease n=1 Tax=Deinococcus metalli TaxID=1141878 RepID=A0A7W8NR21_9DEIO|nr:MFS transporter [Deinococcus metalli]MBB5377450.1 MFS family permease [Deinococcus metalli]GHF50498.1 MFS transporter [Deinococcus metalli]